MRASCGRVWKTREIKTSIRSRRPVTVSLVKPGSTDEDFRRFSRMRPLSESLRSVIGLPLKLASLDRVRRELRERNHLSGCCRVGAHAHLLRHGHPAIPSPALSCFLEAHYDVDRPRRSTPLDHRYLALRCFEKKLLSLCL